MSSCSKTCHIASNIQTQKGSYVLENFIAGLLVGKVYLLVHSNLFISYTLLIYSAVQFSIIFRTWSVNIAI